MSNKLILKAHQKKLIDHICKSNQIPFICTDDTGSGKTIMSLSIVKNISKSKALIITKNAELIKNFENEIEKYDYFSSLNSISFKKGVDLGESNVVITSYMCAKYLSEVTSKNEFDVIILDEVQMIKNKTGGLLHKLVKKIAKNNNLAKKVIGFSATPSGNNASDFIGIIQLMDRKYDSLEKYYLEKIYCYSNDVHGVIQTIYKFNESLYKKFFDEIISKYLVNSGYDKKKDLLDINLKIHMIDDCQAKIAPKIINELKSQTSGDYTSFKNMAINQGVLSGTYKVHPKYLTVDHEPKKYQLWIGNTKIPKVISLINDYLSNGKNIIVVCSFKLELFYMRKAIQSKVKGNRILDISDNVKDVMKRWDSGDYNIMISNIKSISTGLNLQNNGSVIIFTCISNNYIDIEQSIGRIYRTGQKESCDVHFIAYNNYIDLNNINSMHKKKTHTTNIRSINTI